MKPTYLSFLFIAALLLAGCNFNDGGFEQSSNYVVEVESIQAPDTVASDQAFDIRLLGEVGPDGCHSLADIATAPAADSIGIQVIGLQEVSSDQECTQQTVPLDETVQVDPDPSHEDPFIIHIVQPQGVEPLTDTVHVE